MKFYHILLRLLPLFTDDSVSYSIILHDGALMKNLEANNAQSQIFLEAIISHKNGMQAS